MRLGMHGNPLHNRCIDKQQVINFIVHTNYYIFLGD